VEPTYVTLYPAFHLLSSNVSAEYLMSCDLITSKMPVTILPRGGQSTPSHANPRPQDEILDEVPSWADSRTTLVCWSGPGGTGKTTVAHTIAREYDDADDLGLRSFSGGRQEIVMTTTKFCAYLDISNCGKGSISEGANLILKDASRASLMDPLSHFSFQLSKPLITTVNPADPNFIVNGLDELLFIRQLIKWINLRSDSSLQVDLSL